jgi:hypothetical protein
MDAKLLQEFRTMQLAVKGALAMKSRIDVEELLIEGIDSIAIGDNALIDTILLDKDIVNVNIFNVNSLMPIHFLSDGIIEEIVDTMRAKALDIAGTDVMVNFKGEIDYKQIRW